MSAGPQQRDFQLENLQAKQAGVRGPTKRFSTRKSTSKASWGAGPSKEIFNKKIYKQSRLG
ncbi:hypothetical protein D5R77_05745 [Staphylococcus haemolyticus]|nr:hypothetical protein D5R77_05745 [Staphylococcus haemolyticus]